MPELLSISTVMSEWNVAPDVSNDSFDFVPPKDARVITFMSLDEWPVANESGASK